MSTKAGKPSVVLVNIDNDGSFVNPTGSLYVPGAELSANRAVNLIDRNLNVIDLIISSNDTHRQDHRHIFYSVWWIDPEGNNPLPFTDITYAEVLAGRWTPVFDKEWSINYAKVLGSFKIWPPHCDENTPDSQIVPNLAAAINRHAIFNGIDPIVITKGLNRRAEWYGIFATEVEDPDDPKTKFNDELAETIVRHNRIVIIGQEDGHCVKRTREQLVWWCSKNYPKAIANIRYVSDCVNRLDLGPNYEQMTKKSVDDMVEQGMVLIKSTDSLY